MALDPSNLPIEPVIVVINPEEDCSPEVLRSFVDEILAGPEPELGSLGGAEAVRELRLDTEA